MYSSEKITFAAMIGYYLGKMDKENICDSISTMQKVSKIAKAHEITKIIGDWIDTEMFYEDASRYAKIIHEEHEEMKSKCI